MKLHVAKGIMIRIIHILEKQFKRRGNCPCKRDNPKKPCEACANDTAI